MGSLKLYECEKKEWVYRQIEKNELWCGNSVPNRTTMITLPPSIPLSFTSHLTTDLQPAIKTRLVWDLDGCQIRYWISNGRKLGVAGLWVDVSLFRMAFRDQKRKTRHWGSRRDKSERYRNGAWFLFPSEYYQAPQKICSDCSLSSIIHFSKDAKHCGNKKIECSQRESAKDNDCKMRIRRPVTIPIYNSK